MNKMTLLKKPLEVSRWVLKSKVRIAVVVIAILATGFLSYRTLGVRAQQPTYQTATAEKGTLVTSVTTSGTVSQGGSVSITTQATGIVSNVYVSDGDTVTQGQKIADITLDTASQQKVAAAWASYLSAKNTVASAQNSLNSLNSAMWEAQQKFINDAGARGLSTDDPTYIQQHSDWLNAENQYKNQQNVIAAAQASLNSSWLPYAQLSSTITAPSDGVISGLTLAQGVSITSQNNTSTATTSTTTLGTITLNQGQPQVSVNLTEIDVVKVKAGQKVTMTLDAFPGKTFTGKVVAVNTNGSVSSSVTTYPATIVFDSALSNIYPNMGVNATIITDVKSNVVLVPSGAVQTSNGKSSVRVMRNKQITQVTVGIGQSNDTQTEILSGINEGDEIITGQTGSASNPAQGGTSPFGSTNRGFGGQGGFGGGAVRIQR